MVNLHSPHSSVPFMTYIQLCVMPEGIGGFNLLLLLKNLACIAALAVYMYSIKTTGSRHSNFINVFLGSVFNILQEKGICYCNEWEIIVNSFVLLNLEKVLSWTQAKAYNTNISGQDNNYRLLNFSLYLVIVFDSLAF